MPSRNIIKPYMPDAYYHIYARGTNKQEIFLEHTDYIYFLKLLARYLDKDVVVDRNGRPYPNYHNQIELLSYCLMKNHFHILIYQTEQTAIKSFMQSLMTSYVRYFNLKYKRSGSLFESRYKASRITQASYLHHITRYIHMNPRYWRKYPYSSLEYYRGNIKPGWLSPEKILSLFSSPEEYLRFLDEYTEQKDNLEAIKHELADQ